MESKSESKRKKAPAKPDMGQAVAGKGKAKKDWHCHCPPHCDVKFKKGDDLSKVKLPEKIWTSLATEELF